MELNLRNDQHKYKYNFLSDCEKTKSTEVIRQIKCMFNYCAPYEERVHKDLCEFNISELTEMFSFVLETKSIGSVAKDISHLKNYLDYCKNSHKAILCREDIEAITKPYKSVRKWLEDIKPYDGIEYLINIEELYSLENADEKVFTKQFLVFIWLLFIGLDEDEIIYKTEQEIKEWYSWYRLGLTIPSEIKEKIYSLIEKGSKETGITIKSRTEGEWRHVPYKQSPYFFKHTNKKPGEPMSMDTIRSYYKNIKYELNKKTIAKLSLRDSGIIYFAKLLLEDTENIKTIEEMTTQIYEPLSKRFNININTVFTTIRNNSAVLSEFYGISLPVTTHPNIHQNTPLISQEEKFPRPPDKRDPSDFKSYTDKILRGASAEDNVFNWIKKEDPIAFQASDSEGYDIYAPTIERLIEVKTIPNANSSITITRNEYKNCKRLIKYYWFYILVWDQSQEKNSTSGRLYNFKDLLGLLGVKEKTDLLTTVIKTKSGIEINISYESFSVKLCPQILSMANETYILNDLKKNIAQQ